MGFRTFFEQTGAILSLRGVSSLFLADNALSLNVSGVGGFTVGGNVNAQTFNLLTQTELTSVANGVGLQDSTITIPANALVIGVTARVTVLPGGTATMDIGVAGATTRYGTGVSTAATTTSTSPGTTNPTIYSAATAIRYTFNANTTNASGRIRTTIH